MIADVQEIADTNNPCLRNFPDSKFKAIFLIDSERGNSGLVAYQYFVVQRIKAIKIFNPLCVQQITDTFNIASNYFRLKSVFLR